MVVKFGNKVGNRCKSTTNTPMFGQFKFFAISWEPDFPQTCVFLQKLHLDEHFHYIVEKNGHSRTRFSLNSQKPHFRPYLGPFWAIWPQIFFSKIGECQVLNWPKLQLHAKFQRNSMTGCRGKSRTNERTHERTDEQINGRKSRSQNNSPLRQCRGTNKYVTPFQTNL